MSEFMYYRYNAGNEKRSLKFFKVHRETGKYTYSRSAGREWLDGKSIFWDLRKGVRVHCIEITEDQLIVEGIK